MISAMDGTTRSPITTSTAPNDAARGATRNRAQVRVWAPAGLLRLTLPGEVATAGAVERGGIATSPRAGAPPRSRLRDRNGETMTADAKQARSRETASDRRGGGPNGAGAPPTDAASRDRMHGWWICGACEAPNRVGHERCAVCRRERRVARRLADVEREHILAVLAAERNKDRACRILGIGRRTLDVKLHAWGLFDLYRVARTNDQLTEVACD